ncbi:MAG: DUF1177 domain-containing protein [Negativicutes bacterium]|nr:DUF1177 domain-containing protein [Negativicutes bacterium]
MLKQVMEIHELLDSSFASGAKIKELLIARGLPAEQCHWLTVMGEQGSTDFIHVLLKGKHGKLCGGSAPTLGIIGRLGGVGARPERIGLVSDGDGAITAMAVALKLVDMQKNGDTLAGDVIVSTHIAPFSPTSPHEPVPFMGSPVDIAVMNQYEVDASADAILSVDTTKGNRIFNARGFAITPTIKDGWILRISEDLLSIMEWTTGQPARVLPVTMQDITPYGNDLYHLNSILQPSVVTDAALVGVAITTETAVPGCATGASHEIDIEETARFCIEVAKYYGENQCSFYNQTEYAALLSGYGSMSHLRAINPLRK